MGELGIRRDFDHALVGFGRIGAMATENCPLERDTSGRDSMYFTSYGEHSQKLSGAFNLAAAQVSSITSGELVDPHVMAEFVEPCLELR